LVIAAAVTAAIGSNSAYASTTPDGGTAEPSDGEPYRFGYAASVSGPGAVFYDHIHQSAQLAVDEVNAAGFLDRPIELVIADDAGDPRTSGEVCTRLIFDDAVDAIIGAQNSANREGCLPVATQEGVPYLYATPYEGLECAPNFFVVGEVPQQQVDPLVRYMVEEQGSTNWFLTGSDYIAMRGGNEFGRGIIEELGGEVVGEEYAPLGTTDFTSLISNITGSGADTAFVNFLGTDYIAFLEQYSTSPDIEGIKLVTFGIPIGASDDSVNELYTAMSYFPTIESPENDSYKAALEEAYGDDATLPSVISVPSYDSVWLLARAIEAAGSADKEAVIQALHEISFTGPGGVIEFNEQGHPTLPMHIAIWNDEPLKGTEQILITSPPAEPGDQDDGDCAA
jgi:branched-chain amino acid transport system substrate-binding protein